LDYKGLLYLTDCGEKEGAFHCVAGFQRNIEGWLSELPNENPRKSRTETLKLHPRGSETQAIIIWHQALPHCVTHPITVLPQEWCTL
jgi:hypothetical protein